MCQNLSLILFPLSLFLATLTYLTLSSNYRRNAVLSWSRSVSKIKAKGKKEKEKEKGTRKFNLRYIVQVIHRYALAMHLEMSLQNTILADLMTFLDKANRTISVLQSYHGAHGMV